FPALLSTQPLQSEFHMATAADLVDSTINLHRQIRLARADVAAKRQLVEEQLALEAAADAKVEKHMLSADQRLPRTLAQLSHLDAKQAEMNTGILYRRYINHIGAMFSLQMALVSMDVLRVAHSIRALQATLVVQLYDIYPIAYLGAGEYSIGKDEELLSTALGYIAHFVFLVAKYLNVNLRYAIVHLSSRSYMRDDVNDPHGEYPLYKRGVDKDRFDKAFLFLRKDVEQRLLEQAKASMVEQCALEVEATKTLLNERLRKEQRRHAKALEEREKRAEEFCTNLQAKYEDLMGVHDVTWQNQLHAMQQSMHTLLRTHMSLEDHELILTQKTTALNDAHAKAVQLLQTTFDRSMVEAQHVHERTAEAAHHVAVVPLHTTIAELQAKCEQAQAAVDDLTTRTNDDSNDMQ
ncbi:hypothetical protein DYB38_012217, partial [Aphanomyces astaci]